MSGIGPARNISQEQQNRRPASCTPPRLKLEKSRWHYRRFHTILQQNLDERLSLYLKQNLVVRIALS